MITNAPVLAIRLERALFERFQADNETKAVEEIGQVWLEASDEDIQNLADFLIEASTRLEFPEQYPCLSALLLAAPWPHNRARVLHYLRDIREKANFVQRARFQ